MSGSDLYKSPIRKLMKFFEQSRDSWKQKALEHKKENRRLNKKLCVLEIAKKRWKDEAITLRKQLKNIEQASDILENYLAESKKNRN